MPELNIEKTGRAKMVPKARHRVTARSKKSNGRARKSASAEAALTAREEIGEGRANKEMAATGGLTAPADAIDQIRLQFRRAKAAEQSRIRIDLGLYAYARVYFTDWQPSGEDAQRKKDAAQAKRVVDAIRAGTPPTKAEDAPLYEALIEMVVQAEASRNAFDTACKGHRKVAEKLAAQLPAWEDLRDIKGFSAWGLCAIIGEAGDIGDYSGCRKLFKRLGLAPDECYPKGEKSTGRRIPRNTRGRIMGIIADPLLRAQWRGARESDDGGESHGEVDGQRVSDLAATIPAHAIGPYGEVYGSAKARHLAAGRSKGHADKAARRAMVKALLHDVHRAWFGRVRDYR